MRRILARLSKPLKSIFVPRPDRSSALHKRTVATTTATTETPTTINATAIMTAASAHNHYADLNPPICRLEVRPFFTDLTSDEKKYAHYMSRASWEGMRITMDQTNPRGAEIYDLIMAVFKGEDGKLVNVEELKRNSSVPAETFDHFLQYSAQFLGNLSNYKSFGDTKFIPRLTPSEFERIVGASPRAARALELFAIAKDEIFDVEPSARNMLGYPDEGHLTGYYSQDVTKEDLRIVGEYLEKIGLNPLNTRLFKTGPTSFTLRVASSLTTPPPTPHTLPNGTILTIAYGDFTAEMARVASNILGALPYAANDDQRRMLTAYEASFRTGSIDDHKESQRHWIKDLGPSVETNIGFIETYRDPLGVRAEWEGFVAMVNKKQTEKFGRLVDGAPDFLKLLPWGKEFEKDVFKKPDFTSLEVLTFTTAGVPVGINIPNYDDIRQTLGFKNVSLGNILSAKSPSEKTTFIRSTDLALFERLRRSAFELQIGLHELLGHGSGKLLCEHADGTFNFDREHTLSPITGRPVESWYRPGQTWGSVFKALSASYEECRAESVAMHLSTDEEVLKIFGHTKESTEVGTAEEIIYIAWLNMARMGLAALEFYDPKAKKWGQAHMRARFALLSVFLSAGSDFVKIHHDKVADTVEIHLDQHKIVTHGAPAVASFLQRLQVYKATADVAEGARFYGDWTAVSDEWIPLRDLVIKNKLPRKVFVQANTAVGESGEVELVEYEETPVGVVRSFVERGV